MKMIKWFAVSALMTLFAACGGGGGNSGTSSFGSGSGTTTGTGTTGGTTDAGASLVLSISSTTASAATPATVTATVKSSAGTPITGQVVSFSSSGGLGAFNTSSGLTDANGQVAVKLTPASGTSNGADLVLAKTTVGTTLISGSIGFQVSPSSGAPVTGVPSVSVALSTASVTTATPATFTATVRDATGAVAPGQVVRFSTSTGTLGAFNVTSALTDTNGIATAKLTPASSTANGADLAIAQVTVANVLATGSVGFSVTSTGGATTTGAPSIALTLSTSTVTTATPATVTAIVKDATGAGVVGQVVKFSTVDGLGALTVGSALTDNTGAASTTLNATSATQSGADQVLATTTVNGTALQASQGFRLTAASVAIASFTADTTTLSAYGQTGVQISLNGTVPGTPVSVSLTSACIASGKATITPATATTTNGVASFTYRDVGCGATAATDTLRASIAGSAATSSLALTVFSPAATSINFISATPTSIFLKGSGFAETSIVTFRVLDIAGNGLPGRGVRLRATTYAGGLTLDGITGAMLNGNQAHDDAVFPPKVSDSLGNVTLRINSGTVPTPVRVTASLVDDPSTTANEALITTVSSSLAIAVGLPSQLNFSLSQGTRNIEGYNIDGTTNTYNIIASDRLGNPVPAGTAINFVAEGGQVEAIKMTTIDAFGNARATANFLSSAPRPVDGRVTILAYSIGEESFLDLNGDNVYTAGEPFQDLGSLFLNRLFNVNDVGSAAAYNSATDQFIALSLPGSTTGACAPVSSPLLALDVTIPSVPSSSDFVGFNAPPASTPTSCDGAWGKAYVRRSLETVLSTSSARPRWNSAPANLYPLPLFSGDVLAGSTTIGSIIPIFGSPAVGQPVLSTLFPAGTFVTAVTAATVTVSAMATGTQPAANFGNPYALFAGSIAAGSRAVSSIPSTTNLVPGQLVVSPYLPAGTAVVSVESPTQLTLSNAATATGSIPFYVNDCPKSTLIVGYKADETPITSSFPYFGGGTVQYSGGGGSFLVSDNNPIRLNPMAAGTSIAVSGTSGLSVALAGGSPVASTTEATFASFTVDYGTGITSGTVSVSFTSPSGLATTLALPVRAGAAPNGLPRCTS